MKLFLSCPASDALKAALLTALASLAISGCSTLSSLNPFSSKPASSNDAARAAQVDARANVAIDSGAFAAQSKYGYVQVEPIEAGAAANDHPAGFTATQIRAVLAMQKTGRDGNILNDEELIEIAAPIAAALSKASPREDVVFAVAGKHGFIGSIAGPRSVTSGRVFYKNGALNIIFGDIRVQATDELTATGFLQSSVLRQFPPGSRNRATQSADVLAEGGVTFAANNRRDWVLVAAAGIPLPPVAVRAAPAAAGAAPAAAGAAPAADAVRSSAATGADLDIERRLTTLKSLRDKGLITEQEFNDKRKEILKSL